MGTNNTNSVYPDLSNNFPEQIDTFDKWLDPSLEMLADINKYTEKYNKGDLVGANEIIKNNPLLNRCKINANGLNKMIDGIIALQRFYMNDVQQYLVELVKYKKEYSPTTKYSKYNTVYYKVNEAQEVFMCIDNTAPIGTLPTDSNYFIPITLRGQKGESGTGLTPRGIYSREIRYYTHDMVAHSNALWAASKENIDQVPSRNSKSWYLLLEFSAELMVYLNTDSTLNSTTIQDAINELDSKIENIELIDSRIEVTDKNNHFTATKLDGVLNELFTFASSGKNAIADATGIDRNNTFIAIANELKEQKRLLSVAQNMNTPNDSVRTQARNVHLYVHTHLPQIIVQNGGNLVNSAGIVVTPETSSLDTIYYSINNLATVKNNQITNITNEKNTIEADRDYWKDKAENSVQKGDALENNIFSKLNQVKIKHFVGQNIRFGENTTYPSCPSGSGNWDRVYVDNTVGLLNSFYSLASFYKGGSSSDTRYAQIFKNDDDGNLIWERNYFNGYYYTQGIKTGNDSYIYANINNIYKKFDSNGNELNENYGHNTDKSGNCYNVSGDSVNKVNPSGITIWSINLGLGEISSISVNKDGTFMTKHDTLPFTTMYIATYNSDGVRIGFRDLTNENEVHSYDWYLPRNGDKIFKVKQNYSYVTGRAEVLIYDMQFTLVASREYGAASHTRLSLHNNFLDDYVIICACINDVMMPDTIEMLSTYSGKVLNTLDTENIESGWSRTFNISRNGYAILNKSDDYYYTNMCYLKDTYLIN